jgi:GntR family transcriptional regulator
MPSRRVGEVSLRRNTPLAAQAAVLIRKRLRLDYPEGGQIPGEIELANELNVSRGTVRQALAILDREGLIYRRQGSGTYANKYVLQIGARVEHAYEFTDLIRLSGFEAAIVPVEVRHEPASDEAIQRLQIEPGTEMLVVHKLFLADGEPAIYCIDALAASSVKTPYQEEELRAPIFEFLANRCHQDIDYILADILPEMAGEQVSHLLQCSIDDVLLRFDETSFNNANKPVLYSRIHYRSDRIHFGALRKKV